MPNFLQQFRMPNFFSGNTQPEQQMPSAPFQGLFQPKPPEPMQQPQEQNPYMGLMNMETPALDQYNAHLANAPTREDNQLSLIGKILSGVAGGAAGIQGGAGAGYSTTQGLLDSKYDRAMQDYDMSGQNLGLMAQIEGSNQDRSNQLAVMMADQMREDRTEDRAWLNLIRQQGVSDAQVANYKDLMEQRGNITYEDVNTGETIRLLKDGTREVVGQTSQTPEQIAADKAADGARRLADAKELSEFNDSLNANTPGRSLSPSQWAVAKKNATTELIEDNPYFKDMLDETGFRVEGVSDADWAVFEQERNKIITRQGGTTDPTGRRTDDINLSIMPDGARSNEQNTTPSIPLNPSDGASPQSATSNISSREDLIDAIRLEYPDVTDEELTEDYLKQVAQILGYSY